MKRRGAFPHTITVNHKGVTGTDSRNNEVRGTTATIVDIPARVDALVEAEDLIDRDRSTETFTIEVIPNWHGEEIDIAADDTITWQDKLLQAVGAAALETDHLGRRDHLKLTARRIVG